MPITTPEKDVAFIPAPLPTQWPFDIALWPLLAEAKRCLGLLDGAALLLPNPKLFLSPLQRVEALSSSRLEGTYATAQELMLFELNSNQPQGIGDPASAWQEVSNYNRALASGYTQLNELSFSLRMIKNLHRILLSGSRGSSKNPGEFRSHQVHIGSNRRYVPPPPEQAMRCLYDLETYLNHDDDSLDALVRCFVAHYQIEAIHPFCDGNGRIGRVVLSLMIYKWCDLSMPWLYLSPYFERYKDEYIDNLFKVSSEGAWTNWIGFCLRGVIEQAKKAVQTCRRLQELRTDMHSRLKSGGSARTYAIIENLFDSPYVQIAELGRKHSVRYQTAKSDVMHLVEKKILACLDVPGVKTFYAPEVFAIAYGETE